VGVAEERWSVVCIALRCVVAARSRSRVLLAIEYVMQMEVSECDFDVQSHDSNGLCEEMTSILLCLVDLMDDFRVHERGAAAQVEIDQLLQWRAARLPHIHFEIVHAARRRQVAETVAH